MAVVAVLERERIGGMVLTETAAYPGPASTRH
jgi:hypothetical protein